MCKTQAAASQFPLSTDSLRCGDKPLTSAVIYLAIQHFSALLLFHFQLQGFMEAFITFAVCCDMMNFVNTVPESHALSFCGSD